MKNAIFFLVLFAVADTGCSQKSVTRTLNAANLLISSDFENVGSVKKWERETTKDKSFTLSDSVARKGRYSARFELDKDDQELYSGKRSEIHLANNAEAEGWFGFSNYLPKSYVKDEGAECIAQWHETPDFELGETWRSPPLLLEVKNDHFFVVVMWATDPVNTNNTISGRKDFDLGPVTKDVWNDWVFHIKWSWQSDGVLEVWKNKKQVVSYFGPNSYNDQKFPYFKTGIYKWSWNTAEGRSKSTARKRIIYVDEVKVAGKNAGIDAVSP